MTSLRHGPAVDIFRFAVLTKQLVVSEVEGTLM